MTKKLIFFVLKSFIAYIIINAIIAGLIIAPLILTVKNVWLSTVISSVAIFISLFVSLYLITKNSAKEIAELKIKGVLYTCIAASILRISSLISDQSVTNIAGAIISLALFFVVYLLITKKIKSTLPVENNK